METAESKNDNNELRTNYNGTASSVVLYKSSAIHPQMATCQPSPSRQMTHPHHNPYPRPMKTRVAGQPTMELEI